MLSSYQRIQTCRASTNRLRSDPTPFSYNSEEKETKTSDHSLRFHQIKQIQIKKSQPVSFVGGER